MQQKYNILLGKAVQNTKKKLFFHPLSRRTFPGKIPGLTGNDVLSSQQQFFWGLNRRLTPPKNKEQ